MTWLQQNCDPERLVDLSGGEVGCLSAPVSVWLGITSGSRFAHRGAGCPVQVCFLSSHLPYFMLELFQKLISAKCKYKGNLLKS